MRAVDVGIGHYDDLVIADFFYIEILPDTRAERRDNRLKLFVTNDLIKARFFDIQHFSP